MDPKKSPRIESLRFEGVTFVHPGYDPTLKSCDYEFPVGKVVHVKSEEGAGKTTLLQVMAGLLIPQGGKFVINDQDVAPMSFEEFLPYRLNIGFTFDYGGLINNRTIYDNVILPLIYHQILPTKEAHARVRELMDRFDLKKYEHERPAHVPGRVRKLAVLLRGLVAHPDLLLLDDPSVGLGDTTQGNFVQLLNELRDAGKIPHLFISSHDDRFINQFDHQTIHLSAGLIYAENSEFIKQVVNG